MNLKLRYLSANVLKSLILIINVSFFVFSIGLLNAALASDDYSMISTTSDAPKSPYILKLKKTLKCVLRTDIHDFSDTPSKDTNHSSDSDYVGVMYEHLLKGPESFCIDSKRNLYICDTVNKRIIVFDRNGNSSGSVDLDYAPDDITTDDSGNLYVYHKSISTHDLLFQYDKNKSLIGTVDVVLENHGFRGRIYVVKNSVYMVYYHQGDLLIGAIENGVLKQPLSLENSLPVKKGIFGLSGKRYLVHITRKVKADINIYGSGTNDEPTKVSILRDGVLSANFLGEDELGNFYIQTETRMDTDNAIALDVIKCNLQGKVLNILNFSNTDYAVKTVKMFSINNHGDIFQFVPSEEKATINVYSEPTLDK